MGYRQERYFRRLTTEQRRQIKFFEEFIELEAFTVNDLRELVTKNPATEFYFLSIRELKLLGDFFLLPNVVNWLDGHDKLIDCLTPAQLSSGLRMVELYIDWLLNEKKNIVFIIPKDFFTYYSDNKPKDKDMHTIQEFNFLVQNQDRWESDQITFVYDSSGKLEKP